MGGGSFAQDRVLAHGVGGAKDLPIPSELAIIGAVTALVVSFAVLALAWRTPRFDDDPGRPAPAWLATLTASPAFAWTLRIVGLAFAAYVGVAAVFGDNTLTNPFIGVFYVWLWVGLVPVSLLFGPFIKAVSPARTIVLLISRASGVDPEEGMFRYPARLGYWPAALGLFAFVWLELVHPASTELGTIRLWCAVYLVTMVFGGALFGTTFTARADPFEVYSTLVGKLSVWGHRDGRLVLRSPLANLATVVPAPGLTAVVGILFGSTAFDSFRESTVWLKFVQNSGFESRVAPDTVMLLIFSAGMAAILAVATMLTGTHADIPRRALPDLFAHSIVPIVVGYVIAHYLTYFVEYGQTVLIQFSDPLSRGDNLLGTANLQVNYWISLHPTFLATTKVAAVVVGHILAVVSAHDRAVKILPPQWQFKGQLPMLVAMVGFTAGGLYLLFAA